jgi:hypothetical protein
MGELKLAQGFFLGKPSRAEPSLAFNTRHELELLTSVNEGKDEAQPRLMLQCISLGTFSEMVDPISEKKKKKKKFFFFFFFILKAAQADAL